MFLMQKNIYIHYFADKSLNYCIQTEALLLLASRGQYWHVYVLLASLKNCFNVS